MCIVFIAINQHPDYPLIVCANRDEFHLRPTQSAHIWPDKQQLIAGKDLQGGGTWFGVNQVGDFCTITNIRVAEQQLNMQSRGELVVNTLLHPSTIDTDWLALHYQQFNPFNLLFSRQQQIYCFHSPSQEMRQLKDGFHAVCNGALDDNWPKMAKGQQALEQLINQQADIDVDALLNLLKDQSQAPDESLPNTGVSLEWERQLSAIFICQPEYGTRSSTVLLMDNHKQLQLTEVSYTPTGKPFNRQTFHLPTAK